MGNDERKRQDDQARVIKKDANKAWGLLTDQFSKLGSGENPVLKESEFKANAAMDQYENQAKTLENKIGGTGLAGSGASQSARDSLAKTFENTQSFTREQALDTQEGDLDRIRMEMQNLISSTNASVGALPKMSGKKSWNPPGAAAYLETD